MPYRDPHENEKQILETLVPNPLSPSLLQKMHAYWRAANYLSVGQIYLQDNPLLEISTQARSISSRVCLGIGARRRD